MNVAEIIPLTGEVLRHAAECEQQYDLSRPDAIVYASAITHLQRSSRSASLFLNNDKHFDRQDVKKELREYRCKIIFGFDEGFEFMTSQLPQ